MIVSQETIDFSVQANDQHRARVKLVFDDGREKIVSFREANEADYNARIAGLSAEMQAAQEIQDAGADVDPDTEIRAHKQGSAKQQAVEYIRLGLRTEDPARAFLLLDRFETFRQARGWGPGQVVARLSEQGLRQKEWDKARAKYQRLNQHAQVFRDYHAVKQQLGGRR